MATPTPDEATGRPELDLAWRCCLLVGALIGVAALLLIVAPLPPTGVDGSDTCSLALFDALNTTNAPNGCTASGGHRVVLSLFLLAADVAWLSVCRRILGLREAPGPKSPSWLQRL